MEVYTNTPRNNLIGNVIFSNLHFGADVTANITEYFWKD